MNPDTILLFVGGLFDGKRKKWGTDQFAQKCLTQTLDPEPFESWYRVQRFESGAVVHEIAVHDSVKDLLETFMKGYNPKG